MGLSYQDSSDEDNNLTVAVTGMMILQMQILVSWNGDRRWEWSWRDENSNEMDIEISDEESEAD